MSAAKSNKGEPKFAFDAVTAEILAEPSVRIVVGAEGLEPPTYAL
jgi:hypothetical protein